MNPCRAGLPLRRKNPETGPQLLGTGAVAITELFAVLASAIPPPPLLTLTIGGGGRVSRTLRRAGRGTTKPGDQGDQHGPNQPLLCHFSGVVRASPRGVK